jgi:N-acetyl-gamma-glutamyl-phosphate reductase
MVSIKKVAIVGATGYTGQELVRLLLQHDQVELKALTSQSYVGSKFSNVYPNAARFTDLLCSEGDIEKLSTEVDVIFVALPHGHAAKAITRKVLDNSRVIDLGADFRLKNPEDYKTWYQLEHANPGLIKGAVYGLPELNRADIASARLVANPGCYATCSILTLAPLMHSNLIDENSIIIDAKSGVTGAGRSLALSVHFDEVNESLKAYKVASHRHTPEIEQALKTIANHPVTLTFTPHLIPMNRGILVTAYANLKSGVEAGDINAAYQAQYGNEYFIRLFNDANAGGSRSAVNAGNAGSGGSGNSRSSSGSDSSSSGSGSGNKSNEDYTLPETRWVKGSNFCDIGVTIDKRNNRLIAIGAIDNLVKGAAGQAIQNMNILFGFDETSGLKQMPIFPA